MKSRPILFSTEMVQALLEDRKSQTRRTKGLNYINTNPDNWEIEYLDSIWAHGKDFEIKELKPPYEIGDILWVRESFHKYDSEEKGIIYSYKADHNVIANAKIWKPSIHMPKEACRLFLKITNVRVERLWDISEEDAKAEGCSFEIVHNIKEYKDYLNPNNTFPVYAKLSFISLWEKINGVKSLEENPFVWVIEFERIEKPKNF